MTYFVSSGVLNSTYSLLRHSARKQGGCMSATTEEPTQIHSRIKYDVDNKRFPRQSRWMPIAQPCMFITTHYQHLSRKNLILQLHKIHLELHRPILRGTAHWITSALTPSSSFCCDEKTVTVYSSARGNGPIYRVSQKWPPMLFRQNFYNQWHSATLSAKFYTHTCTQQIYTCWSFLVFSFKVYRVWW